MTGFAAVVLAGGAARRMGGVDKPDVPVGGVAMRDRVLAAVAGADPRVVVGPLADPPPGVLAVREEPPGAGPVAATAAGLAALAEPAGLVALLAGDLPLLTADAVDLLTQTVRAGGVDGALYVDATGRRQLLCGVWRTERLRAAVDRLAARRDGGLVGASMRALLGGLSVAEVTWPGVGPAPWFDCDTDQDVRQAREWTR
ncbi:molybdopterin-guanine dinucleotide biosynthesis protein A [Micromonospora sp. Llam0]|uniref:molybdenum cofactor guanylyltransferase n=1 Tax=Micromonospora sp. Llam0 TaxID=2485143 RepID=UPI000F48D9DF|nr:NTP transferase domain-containing protein [Micromonospora sp. Llam0]ROO52656.1 molybdopterin-guanine dinucleotide biosynthesis protein A [Micromonospora sp. Llam0]